MFFPSYENKFTLLQWTAPGYTIEQRGELDEPAASCPVKPLDLRPSARYRFPAVENRSLIYGLHYSGYILFWMDMRSLHPFRTSVPGFENYTLAVYPYRSCNRSFLQYIQLQNRASSR